MKVAENSSFPHPNERNFRENIVNSNFLKYEAIRYAWRDRLDSSANTKIHRALVHLLTLVNDQLADHRLEGSVKIQAHNTNAEPVLASGF